MRKIHPGLIAIAILGGPASIILGHQKLTETLPQEMSRLCDVTALVSEAYSRGSKAPELLRSSQCDPCIRSSHRCVGPKKDCEAHSIDEVVLKLNFTPLRLDDKQAIERF
jgi:hypothetical protein